MQDNTVARLQSARLQSTRVQTPPPPSRQSKYSLCNTKEEGVVGNLYISLTLAFKVAGAKGSTKPPPFYQLVSELILVNEDETVRSYSSWIFI
jgi:hypothetical protein